MNFTSSPSTFRTLFIGNFSSDCNEFNVYQHFSQFGEIEEVKVMRGKGKKVLGYGFVTYVHKESGALAIERSDGMLFHGRSLKVGWAQGGMQATTNSEIPHFHSYGNPHSSPLPTVAETAQVHFSYLTHNVNNHINEETIRSFFSRYGEIKDVSIKKNDFNPLTQKRSGYGFLHFPLTVPGILAALQVTRDFHNVLVKDVYFNCSVTHQLNQILERHPEIRPQFATTTVVHPHDPQINSSHSAPLPPRLPRTEFPVSSYPQPNQTTYPIIPSHQVSLQPSDYPTTYHSSRFSNSNAGDAEKSLPDSISIYSDPNFHY